ncbi:MAG: alpha-amylase family glycosyl hydrolase [Bacteroidota bacterium]
MMTRRSTPFVCLCLGIFFLTTSLFAQSPTIDGTFDGTAVWGTPIGSGTSNGEWANAEANNLYLAEDACYLYLAAEVNAAQWMNWVFALNTTTGGGTTDTWSRSIDYLHSDTPDIIFRGHFDNYAQFHTWNGSSWDGIGPAMATTEFAENIVGNTVQSGYVEVRIPKTDLNGATNIDVQFYITGDNNDHGSFDAIPDDDNATSWNESSNRTPLDQYISNITISAANGGNTVAVNPAFPAVDEVITLTFNAACTPLAGESKVYFHSGVSLTESVPTSFDRVVGNWGQDDGVGEMTQDAVDPNLWTITLTSLNDYYGVDVTEDIFGWNYLFRSANGTKQEDRDGNNYYTSVSIGSYFSIRSPLDLPYLGEVNSSFDITAEGSTTAQTWTLQEVNANGTVQSTISTQNGGATFITNITLTSTDLKRYKIIADFGGGLVRHKFVEAKGYGAIVDMARPTGMQPGINYHPNDQTKATLILHAPVYTRFYKGEDANVLTGTKTTTPKDVVYVVGSFTNWELQEAYKMNRDRDGWDGVTDADADGDRGDYWWIELSGLTPGQDYVFQYYMSGGIQIADPYANQISDRDDSGISNDVYPNLVAYPSDAVGRASVLRTGESDYVWEAATFTKPDDWDLNIYEMHFRDFTEEGTYLAAIEKLEYLENMGINAIHVMPVSEFEGNSSWGYNPNFYFAADKAYGTPNDLKKFIDECHKREIQVFNDLVLNHAFESAPMAIMYWDEIPCVSHKPNGCPSSENPWLNKFHTMVFNTAGHWGVDWNHESEHTQAWVDRALDYWLQEFQFDGFRFDFTKGIGQTAQDPNDEWASSTDNDRIGLLKRMVKGMWTRNPESVVIFEHLAWDEEDRALANFDDINGDLIPDTEGILMWSGVGHHNDMKRFILGYNQDNTDIYTSGTYNAKGFDHPNWMSYPESHDEQRLAYELQNFYAGFDASDTAADSLTKVIDRLKIAWSFNLLFEGPRMVWQFGELGYDFDINFNGRTGEKPVRWDYYNDLKRRELYRLHSILLNLRNDNDLYASTPDYGNIGLGAGNLAVPRRMKLNGADNKQVIVIANLDLDNAHTVTPGFDYTGTWYRFNGDLAVDGSSFQVSSPTQTYSLAPSEVLVLTNFEVATTKELQIKIGLEGAYDGLLMRDDLRAQVPVNEPFTALPNFAHVGQGGGESILSEALTTTGDDAIVDWVFVELRSPTDMTQVIATRSALLQKDGDVVDVDGVSPLTFNVLSGNYFVSVRHRDHLGLMTGVVVNLSN